MKKRKIISTDLPASRIFSVSLMFAALLFLTCINFFLYPPAEHHVKIAATSETSQKNLPGFPVEEKSGISSFSIVEELMHENHFQLNHVISIISAGFNRLPTGEPSVGHFELISPPPEL